MHALKQYQKSTKTMYACATAVARKGTSCGEASESMNARQVVQHCCNKRQSCSAASVLQTVRMGAGGVILVRDLTWWVDRDRPAGVAAVCAEVGGGTTASLLVSQLLLSVRGSASRSMPSTVALLGDALILANCKW